MVIHQHYQFEIFKGLSDPCPPVMEKIVRNVLKWMDDPYVVAISVLGWEGIGHGRAVKYVAKKAMELKMFDDLIWVTRRGEYSSMKNFQLQIADSLRIAYQQNNETDDDDDGQAVDEVLKTKIKERLQNRNFLLVHNGDWSLFDFGKMGIPSIRTANYFVILVACRESKEPRLHHRLVSMRNIQNEHIPHLLQEECIDIAYSPDLQGHMTSDAIMACISYFLLIDVRIRTQTLLLCWFAEGFIGSEPSMDLEAILKLGEALLDELYDRGLVKLQEEWIFPEGIQLKLKNRAYIFPHRILYTSLYDISEIVKWEELDRVSFLTPQTSTVKFPIHTPNHRISHTSLYDISEIGKREELDRISFITCNVKPAFLPQTSTVKFPLHAPNCTKLSTVFCTGISENVEFPEYFFENMKNVRVLSLANCGIRTLPSSFVSMGNLKLLNLQNCASLDHLHQVSYFRPLAKLEVLDLSYTPLQDLPGNCFESMQQSLRFLDLSECPNLVSLPSSVFCLLNLEQLFLRNCKDLSVLPSSIPQLAKLQNLYVSGTKLIEIPEQFFLYMVKIKDLNLSSNHCLRSLPASIANLVNLKILSIKHCSSLQKITPTLRRLSPSVEELNLSACISLQDIKHVTSSFLCQLPNLRLLDLSQTPIDMISIRNHSSLENIILQSNENLQMLALTGTRLNRFPLEDGPNLLSLSHLNLLGVRHLCKVNWANIHSLPQEVNVDQCGDGSISHMEIPLAEWRKDGNGCGSFISVENGRFFKTLPQDHPLVQGRFLVYLCPFTERGKGKALPLRLSVGYHYKELFRLRNPGIPFSCERCLEIDRIDRFPRYLSSILSRTCLLSLHDEGIIIRLSDLGVENMDRLRHCWIERCHEMKIIFQIDANDLAFRQPLLGCLENLRISNLKKLTNMCVSSGVLENGSFGSLRHLQLEYCPQVVTVFSSGVCLESLEVLKIRFCARLEEIFSALVNGDRALQHLHTLCLWELPKLRNIAHNAQLVSLRNTQVKGCPNLHKLPFTSKKVNPNKVASIVIIGELEWWQQLEWEDNVLKEDICFKRWMPYQFQKHTRNR